MARSAGSGATALRETAIDSETRPVGDPAPDGSPGRTSHRLCLPDGCRRFLRRGWRKAALLALRSPDKGARISRSRPGFSFSLCEHLFANWKFNALAR